MTDEPDDHRLARGTDPESSHLGAASNRARRGHEKETLLRVHCEYMVRAGSDYDGLIDDQWVLEAGEDPASSGLWRRCSDLRTEGKVEFLYDDGVQRKRLCERTGVRVGISYLTPAGVDAFIVRAGARP